MEKYFIAALLSIDQLGNKRVSHLISHFGSAKEAWLASEFDLLDAGLSEKIVDNISNARHRFPDMTDEILSRCDAKGIRVCSIYEDDYPDDLRSIPDAPLIFYYRGTLSPKTIRLSMVGTREFTRYGENVTLEVAEQLARAGVTIVSGGASGIDTFAHRGALRGGRTVAVLGCGIEVIYPSTNKKLFDQIIERGAIISEYPPRTPPQPGQFPKRNRIIAGLSRGVIVVEAGRKSGALNTAQHALKYSRPLFAVPGSIYAAKSLGCNELIHSQGAQLVRNARDILKVYGLSSDEPELESQNAVDEVFAVEQKPAQMSEQPSERSEPPPELEGDEALAYSLLDDQPTDLDGLINRCDQISDRGFTTSELNLILMTLGFKGLVLEDELGNYSRR